MGRQRVVEVRALADTGLFRSRPSISSANNRSCSALLYIIRVLWWWGDERNVLGRLARMQKYQAN